MSTGEQWRVKEWSQALLADPWSSTAESIEKRPEGGRHPVGAIRPGISGHRPPTRICDESPLHHGLYPYFAFVYIVLAGVSTQHAADSPPVRFGAAFSMVSAFAFCASGGFVV